ncbi:hypothetical protein BSZ36_17035 [Rubricoccus marinus]|uniref:Uncharacterized protein n=1 Tax=Rubricoccus marinus TaxID=716817 RepID=A0A259TUH3_9BACT|nr:hypothetical protein BSZ36_17035 [Rubricoccus marinus]
MGMDICLCVERRGANGLWERAEPLVPIQYPYDDFPYPVPGLEREALYEGRNRTLFRLLQGPIWQLSPGGRSLPYSRGLPDDVSAETRAAFDCDNDPPDLFGMSWLLLAELEAFDWSQPLTGSYHRPSGESVTEERPLSHWCKHFLGTTVSAMRELGPPEGVRAVFWFGN